MSIDIDCRMHEHVNFSVAAQACLLIHHVIWRWQ